MGGARAAPREVHLQLTQREVLRSAGTDDEHVAPPRAVRHAPFVRRHREVVARVVGAQRVLGDGHVDRTARDGADDCDADVVPDCWGEERISLK